MNTITPDLVKVVRCKNCRFFADGQCDHPRHERHALSIWQKPDDFCNYGERLIRADIEKEGKK